MSRGAERRGTTRPVLGPLFEGAWAGRRCFLIGGGPTLRGFDWASSPLRHELTIGVNESFDLPGADWDPSLVFTLDRRWGVERKDDPRWARCRSLKVYCDVSPEGVELGDLPGPNHVPFDVLLGTPGKVWSRSLAAGLVWTCNSGLAAINLAELLGAEAIYLLGFDCRGEGELSAHWHDRYDEHDQGRHIYGVHRGAFELYAPEMRARVALLTDSELTCFPRIVGGL